MWLTIVAAAVVFPAGYFGMVVVGQRLQTRYATMLLAAGLVLLSLFSRWPPAPLPNTEELGSIRRIKIGIGVGATVLIVVCLLVFWPR